MMKNFCMPADFKTETIDEYDKLNQAYTDSRIIETYGNITVGNTIESGRAVSQLPRVDLSQLQRYVVYSQERDIDFNYTINAPNMQNREFTEKGVLEIKRFLSDLYEAGVRSLTIALLPLMELVKSTGLDFKIKASTLCEITNPTKARAFKALGVERIVPDESLYKNFRLLKKVARAFADKVEIIVNPICYKNCIYRMAHYNQIAVDSVGHSSAEVSTNYYEHRCVMQRYGRISNLLRLCWVRPEDLKYYTAIGIHYFKLQGRHLVLLKGGDPVRTVKAYLEESYDGDFMDLIYMFATINNFNIPLDNKKLDGFIKPFYEEKIVCDNDCDDCGYCDNFAKKCIDFKQAEETVRLAREFYNEYDQYKQLLEQLDAQKVSVAKNTYREDDKGFNL